jgi:hypothetical protein
MHHLDYAKEGSKRVSHLWGVLEAFQARLFLLWDNLKSVFACFAFFRAWRCFFYHVRSDRLSQKPSNLLLRTVRLVEKHI